MSAEGNPSTKLDDWMDFAKGANGQWTQQLATNAELLDSLGEARRAGYQIKGVQVQVGVPAPGATGATQISIKPWLPN